MTSWPLLLVIPPLTRSPCCKRGRRISVFNSTLIQLPVVRACAICQNYKSLPCRYRFISQLCCAFSQFWSLDATMEAFSCYTSARIACTLCWSNMAGSSQPCLLQGKPPQPDDPSGFFMRFFFENAILRYQL
jgi:hypothetical protein